MTENTTLPGWRQVRKLGSGSFGTVYEICREDDHSYRAALKVITIPQEEAEVTNAYNEGMDDDSVSSYFESMVEDVIREIAVMDQFKGLTNIVSYEEHKVIQHQNDIGWDVLIRMELLTPLQTYEHERGYGLTEEETIKLGKDICQALAMCEICNVIHRDIKPENIFVNRFGDFVLGDFGIARQMEKSMGDMSVKGTPNYMAPEVYNGRPYGKTVDIYSLGMVLYRCLNDNRGPFLPLAPKPITFQERLEATKRRMSGEKLPDPRNGDVWLKQVVLKAVSYHEKDRFQNAEELRRALLDRTLISECKERKRIKEDENDYDNTVVESSNDNVIDDRINVIQKERGVKELEPNISDLISNNAENNRTIYDDSIISGEENGLKEKEKTGNLRIIITGIALLCLFLVFVVVLKYNDKSTEKASLSDKAHGSDSKEVVNTSIPTKKEEEPVILEEETSSVDEVGSKSDSTLSDESNEKDIEHLFNKADATNGENTGFSSRDFLYTVAYVYQMAHDGNFEYGDSNSDVPCEDGKISGDRLISRALWNLGFHDQPPGGKELPFMDEYLLGHGFVHITEQSQIKPGDIVITTADDGEISHNDMMVVLSYDNQTGNCYKYQTTRYTPEGELRIQCEQPFYSQLVENHDNRKYRFKMAYRIQ